MRTFMEDQGLKVRAPPGSFYIRAVSLVLLTPAVDHPLAEMQGGGRCVALSSLGLGKCAGASTSPVLRSVASPVAAAGKPQLQCRGRQTVVAVLVVRARVTLVGIRRQIWIWAVGRRMNSCERSEQLSVRGLSPRTNRYKFSILFQK